MDKHELNRVIDHVANAIESAPRVEKPFLHLTFEGIFPPDIYAEMLRTMPQQRNYRALPGRNRRNIRKDGTATRVKMDLFPEYIRKLPEGDRTGLVDCR